MKSALRALRQCLGRVFRPPDGPSITGSPPSEAENDRLQLARRYLRGDGIELGALDKPLALPAGVRVRYVDRLDREGLAGHYPDADLARFVDVDVVDDGERLERFAAASVDFVVANHFLEHCEDPIGALLNFLRVVRPAGVVYLAVPDMRFTFDHERRPTTLEHLVRDHEQGPECSRRGHYEEYIRVVHKVTDEAWAADRLQHCLATRLNIHFHAWTQWELLELLRHVRRTGPHAFDLAHAVASGEEVICILVRGEAGATGAGGG